MEENIEAKVVAVLPVSQKEVPLDREEILKMIGFYSKLVKDYVGRNLDPDDLIDVVKKALKCKETKTCKKLYGGHEELDKEDLSSILQLLKSSEQKAYMKLDEEYRIKHPDFEKDFDTFLYTREEGNSVYVGTFGLKKDKNKLVVKRELVHKCDLIRIKYAGKLSTED